YFLNGIVVGSGTTYITDGLISTAEGDLTLSAATGAKVNIASTNDFTVHSQAIFTRVPTLAHVFSAWPTGTSNVANSSLYINPASATADSNLLGLAINGTPKFIVDAEGDVYANNIILAGSVSSGATTIGGNLIVQDNTTLGDAGTDTVTVNANSVTLAGTAPVINATNASATLSINTVTNRPVTFGTGLLTVGGNQTINGSALTLAGNNTVIDQTGTGILSLNTTTNRPITTGTGLLTTGGNLTVNGVTTSLASTAINLTGSSPVLDLTTATTLSINTTTNRPVTFGTGLVTANNFGSSSVAITGGTINNTTIGITTPVAGNFTTIGATTTGTGAFTTLTNSGNATLATGASTTNTFGSGASSINTIGSTTTPGALTLHGATTLDNTFSQTGANTFSTGTGAVSLNGATTVTGTNTFSTGTGIVTLNNVSTNISSTNPVIDTTSVSTLFINSVTNRPVTFGTGLVTIPNLTVTAGQTLQGNLTLDKTNTATAVTQYPSYDAIWRGSGWDTTAVAAVNLQQTLRTIAGSGASAAVPYRTAILNNGGTEYVTFDGLNQRVGIGQTAPSSKLDVNGSANFAGSLRVYGVNNVFTRSSSPVTTAYMVQIGANTISDYDVLSSGFDIGGVAIKPSLRLGANENSGFGQTVKIGWSDDSNNRILSIASALFIEEGIKGGTLTINETRQLYIAAPTLGSVNNYSAYIAGSAAASSGTNTTLYLGSSSGATTANYALYQNGTAKNYFSGEVLLNTTTAIGGTNRLNVSGDINVSGTGTFVNLSNTGTINLGTTATNPQVIIGSNSITGYASILMYDKQTSGQNWIISAGGAAAGTFTVREYGVANWLTIAKTTGLTTFTGNVVAPTLALGGATIGSNALAVTGTANVSGAVTVGSITDLTVTGNTYLGTVGSNVQVAIGSNSITGNSSLLMYDKQTGGVNWIIGAGLITAGNLTIREYGVGNWLTIAKTTGNVGIGTTAPGELFSLGLAGTTKGVLSLSGNTSGKIIIQPAAAAGTYTLTLPTAVGAAGTYLKDAAGDGILSWATAGTGTVTSVSVVSANGFAGTVATATTTPAITLTTSITGLLKGNGTAMSAATSGTDYSLGTSALATGILKSTITTGALTIAVAGDFPTLNQDTTGTATNATNTGITDDTTTAATMYPTWVTTTTGNLPQKVSSTKLSFIPSTGVLTATGFSGPLTGNVTGNVSGTAATVTGAAQSAITSVGTLTGLTMGGTLAMGVNSITMTGSLAATGARVTKGWFTDLESTNPIVGSITGNAATVTGLAVTAGQTLTVTSGG
ncbi:MAG: hypothetical protein WC560_12600, partial [Syntrophales bacterium]